MASAKIDIYSQSEWPKQKSIERGPLDLVRQQTDFKFIVAFAICIVIWIITGIYAICVGDSILVHLDNTLDHRKIIGAVRILYFFYKKTRYYILVFSLLSVAILTFYMVMFRWTTKFLIGFTMVLLFLYIALSYGFVILKKYQTRKLDYRKLITSIVLTMSYVLMLTLFVKAGMNPLCKVMKQSFKAMFFFPSTLFVMAAQFVVQILLICFCGAVFAFLKSIKVQVKKENPWASNVAMEGSGEGSGDSDEDSNESTIAQLNLYYTPYYVYPLHFINFFGYIWACCFVMGFGKMILSATFATWYQVEDKSKIPRTTTLKCFVSVLKHHAGTAALATTPFSIFFVFYVIYEQGLDKLKGVFKRPLYILPWLLAIIKLPFDALAISAIHGKGFLESLRDSYNLLMKNPIAFLSIETLSDNITFFGILLWPALSGFSARVYYAVINRKRISARYTGASVFVISFMMSLTLLMVFRAASNTIRYCYLEENKFNHESEMKSYQIQSDDKDTDYSTPQITEDTIRR